MLQREIALSLSFWQYCIRCLQKIKSENTAFWFIMVGRYGILILGILYNVQYLWSMKINKINETNRDRKASFRLNK